MAVDVLSPETRIAESMVDDLAEHSFAQSIRLIKETSSTELTGIHGTVVRTYVPEYSLVESDELRVSVTPVTIEQTRYTRKHMKEIYGIDTTIHKRITVRSNGQRQFTEPGDLVMKIARQIQEHFERPVYEQLPDGSNHNCDHRTACLEDCGLGCTYAWWMRMEREMTYQIGEAQDFHVVLTNIRHLWMTIREICCCA